MGGCGGPSQQVLTAQALSQRQAPNPNKDLQHQLMVHATQASLASYKDYQVGPEDQLDIEIYGQEKLNRELRVNGQGEITMPLVGVVKVAGMTPQEIEKRLAELYDAQYPGKSADYGDGQGIPPSAGGGHRRGGQTGIL